MESLNCNRDIHVAQARGAGRKLKLAATLRL
jgi:hypothetical protein